MNPKHLSLGMAFLTMLSLQPCSAALQASLPEFQSPQQLAASKHAAQSVAASASASEGTFYTGKPFDAQRDGYLFKYRSYDPELNRWASLDPSGFPDGSNNAAYLPVPTSQFDWQGLLVTGTYSITQRKMVLTDSDTGKSHTWNNLHSGNDDYNSQGSSNTGPLPTGDYNIYTWNQFGGNFYQTGKTAFILDPNDSNPLNDTWDGRSDDKPGNGRFGFRMHTGDVTQGCITMSSNALNVLINFLKNTAYSTTTTHITSPPPGVTDFYEYHLGSLTVVE
jgi:RHS repeat-associated protein